MLKTISRHSHFSPLLGNLGYRGISSGGRAPIELDDVLDVNRLPTQNRELMYTVFAAFRDYRPRPYAGTLTLFRAQTRGLLSDSQHDLGWGHYVDALEIRQISGKHGSILHPPHIGDLARQLGGLMDELAPGEPAAHENPTDR